MQRTVPVIILLFLSFWLSACNLGANAVQEPTEVIEQPTIIVQEPTDTPTAQASVTPLPTQQTVATTSSCTPRTDWTTYTVVAGDTLSRIAARGNTTVNILVTANCLRDANVISPGQVLRVPAPVTAATPIVITSTPVPQTSNACRLTMTGQRLAYSDQSYIMPQQLLNAGESYLVTGHNFWNYRIQLSSNLVGWLQKTISEEPTGNCGSVPEVGLSYSPFGAILTDVCYFVPFGNDFPAYFEQAQTTSLFTLSSHQYYFVDARATNGYRIVSGENLPFPAWVSSNSGGLEGNCTTVPDFSVSTTRNGATALFSPNDFPLEFDYPANWLVTPLGDGLGGYMLGTFPRFGYYPGASPLPSDIVRVGANWLDNSQWTTPQEFAEGIVADIRNNPSRVSVVQDAQAITMASGLAGYHLIISTQGVQDEQYIFEIDGKLVMFSVYGNQSHATRVVESVRIR